MKKEFLLLALLPSMDLSGPLITEYTRGNRLDWSLDAFFEKSYGKHGVVAQLRKSLAKSGTYIFWPKYKTIVNSTTYLNYATMPPSITRIALPRAGLLPGACFIVTAVGLHT